jgi:F-type H+-transporting ATPase subunit O
VREKLTEVPCQQYTAAAKNSSIENVSKALESLNATFKKDPKLQHILTSPTLTVQDKKQIVAELEKGINVQDKTNTVSGFLNTLAENNRLSVLEGVTEKFAQLMSASRGEVELNITSAAPLDGKTIKQLEAAVLKSQYVGASKKVKVVTKVSKHERLACCATVSMC